MARIDAFLQLGREQGGSDIHLAVGMPPMLRLHGDLIPLKYRNLEVEELEHLLMEILTEAQQEMFASGMDVDFSYAPVGLGRFRANLFRKTTGSGAVFRIIPTTIPSLKDLSLPPIVEQLTHFHQGLVLVTGATGTGKTTTLAAMIDHINSTRRFNIITLEDPIECIHTSKMSQVIQREVGTHVLSFAEGLRAALREDPDVILVGELRDPETIAMALMAAETGHLVLSTLHTTSASKTLERIIDAVPNDQKAQIATSLAQSLHGVISQVLVRTADNCGRKAVLEILVVTSAVARLLTTGKIFQIPSLLETGRSKGMILMDQALLEGLHNKNLDPNDAYAYANDKKKFESFVTDQGLLPQVGNPIAT